MKTLKRLLITVLVLGMSVGFNTVTYASEIRNEIQTQGEFYYDGLSTEAQAEITEKLDEYCETRDLSIFALRSNKMNHTAELLGIAVGTTYPMILGGMITTIIAGFGVGLSEDSPRFPKALRIFKISAITTIAAGIATPLLYKTKSYFELRHSNDERNIDAENYLNELCKLHKNS